VGREHVNVWEELSLQQSREGGTSVDHSETQTERCAWGLCVREVKGRR
jgi:hypothetical protein